MHTSRRRMLIICDVFYTFGIVTCHVRVLLTQCGHCSVRWCVLQSRWDIILILECTSFIERDERADKYFPFLWIAYWTTTRPEEELNSIIAKSKDDQLCHGRLMNDIHFFASWCRWCRNFWIGFNGFLIQSMMGSINQWLLNIYFCCLLCKQRSAVNLPV